MQSENSSSSFSKSSLPTLPRIQPKMFDNVERGLHLTTKGKPEALLDVVVSGEKKPGCVNGLLPALVDMPFRTFERIKSSFSLNKTVTWW